MAERRDVTITRVFSAPREIVWKYWTEPEYLMRWWGPQGYTSPSSRIDLRVGGRYLSVMQSPEGERIWSTGVYEEIVPPEKVVVTDSFADESGNVVPATHYGMKGDFPLSTRITITLEEDAGKTRMTVRHEGLPAGEIADGTEVGWNESFDKLESLLMRMAA